MVAKRRKVYMYYPSNIYSEEDVWKLIDKESKNYTKKQQLELALNLNEQGIYEAEFSFLDLDVEPINKRSNLQRKDIKREKETKTERIKKEKVHKEEKNKIKKQEYIVKSIKSSTEKSKNLMEPISNPHKKRKKAEKITKKSKNLIEKTYSNENKYLIEPIKKQNKKDNYLMEIIRKTKSIEQLIKKHKNKPKKSRMEKYTGRKYGAYKETKKYKPFR